MTANGAEGMRASSAFTPRNELEKSRDYPCGAGRIVPDDDIDVGCRPRSRQVQPSSSEIRRYVEATEPQ